MTTVTAEDSSVNLKNIKIDIMPYVEDKDPLAVSGEPARINQQQVLPSAIQNRLLANLFSTSPSDTTQALYGRYENLPNSTSVSFLFRVANTSGLQVFAIPEVTFRINNELYPNSTYGFGAAPVFVYNDLSQSNGNDMVTRAAIRNNSGAAIALIECYCRFRIITNPSPDASIVT